MVVRNLQPKMPKESIVDVAIAALDGNPSPLDMDARDIDLDPTSLDMPEEEYQEARSNPRCTCPDMDACGRRARGAGQWSILA